MKREKCIIQEHTVEMIVSKVAAAFLTADSKAQTCVNDYENQIQSSEVMHVVSE